MENFDNITAFIRSVFNEPVYGIPLHEPRFIGNEKKYLKECIESNYVSSVGEYVGRFEKMCAEYTGAPFAVAAVNGTAALHISLQLAGVKRDDEVITQALTFIATANAISYTGAKPVFIDVDRETLGLSPEKLADFLSKNTILKKDGNCYNRVSGKRISACLPMHTFGHPVRLEEIRKLLKKYKIPMVEDSAESLGSFYKGKHTGTLGQFGILSFNGNKIITTGGGGMILTNDAEAARLAKHITTQAKLPHTWEFNHDMVGYNYRLTNIAAAVGCAQLENLEYFVKKKRELAARYKDFFSNTSFSFISEPENCRSNYWLNAILTRDREERDNLLQFTNEKGVMTRPVWTLMNHLPMFNNCQTDGLENSTWLADRIVNLPSSAIVSKKIKKQISR